MQFVRAILVVVLLLAVGVQLVRCSDDAGIQRSPSLYHVGLRSQSQNPPREDPCESHEVACNPAGSVGAQAVIVFTSVVYFFFFVLPLIRVFKLHHGSRTESDTQFWWYLCCSGAGYILWISYFNNCRSYPRSSVFPIYVRSILGAIVQCILLVAATCFTLGVRDKRPYVATGILGLSIIAAAAGPAHDRMKWIGWAALSITALSHCFRFGAINHRDNFRFWLCDVSVPIWLVNALLSMVGAISAFLWLRHPQLCLSIEYKITSYIIGVFRVVEVYMWCSRGLVRGLSKIEGQTTVDV